MLEKIIEELSLLIVIPVMSFLITKYFDYRITKKIDNLQKDIVQIKKELQIDTSLKEQLERIEAVSNYCVNKYKHASTKAVFCEKNRKFIECIRHIILANKFNIEFWDEAKNILDSGYFYCEKYIKQSMPAEFADEFLEEHKINYKIFLQDLENLVFSNINQKIIKIIDLCVSFIKRYNQIAERLEK